MNNECFDVPRLKNSLLLESGTTVLSTNCQEGFAELRVQGEVKIIYKEEQYRYPVEFPEDLVFKLRHYIDDGSYEVVMGNWFEVFVYDEKCQMITSDVLEVDDMSYQEAYDETFAYMKQVLKEEKRGHVQGVCPVCSSMDIEYGVLEPIGLGGFYPATCNECGSTFEEHYLFSFLSHANIKEKEQ